MRKNMVRTIETTVISATKVAVDGGKIVESALENVTVLGKVKEENADKIVRKELGLKGNIIVRVDRIESTEKMYSMAVTDFIRLAQVVDHDDEDGIEE